MTTSSILNTTPTPASASSAAASLSASSASAASIQNTFLTLLVTQLKNQDPTNPMDNSQITNQLAQISSVGGIQQLNTTMQSLATSFATGQSLQAASMIGQTVLTGGNSLALSSGPVSAGVQLTGSASDVSVQVMDPTGAVVSTIDLGAQSSGVVPFQWNGTTNSGALAAAGNYTFSVKAVSGTQSVGATPLAAGAVNSITLNNGSVVANVSGLGNVPRSQIVSIY